MGKWLISKPYPDYLLPIKNGYSPEYLDRVEFDIHYPMGMAILMTNPCATHSRGLLKFE